MSTSDERRWQQRLDNFGTALAQLTSACERERYDELERAGLIKTFEFCSELSWNVLKDLLLYEVTTRRCRVRRSARASRSNISTRSTAKPCLTRDKRNLLSHTYRSEVARDAETLIKDRYHPVLLRVTDPWTPSGNYD